MNTEEKTVQARLQEVMQTLPEHVRLVAVSKFHPQTALTAAYEAGQRIFGESRVQELQVKQAALPADIEWHFIGHLQANKVKYIAPYVSLIHAIDSEKLLLEVEKQGSRCQRIIPCLLQLHIAREETKFGFTPEELLAFLATERWKTLTHVQISGLMCMASYTDDLQQVRHEFRTANELFDSIRHTYFSDRPSFKERSWGMSHDYLIAIEEGSTLVRVGTKIFGERSY